MYSKVNYTLVGFFVLFFAAAIVGAAFWLGKQSVDKEANTYKLYMKDSIAGLSKGSEVHLSETEALKAAEGAIEVFLIHKVLQNLIKKK